MKLSKSGIGNTKLSNIDEMYPGQSILMQTGQLVQYGAGLFGYNNIPLLVKRNLERMRKFYCYFQITTTVSSQLSWSHCLELIKIDEDNKRQFYLQFAGFAI